MSSFGTVLPREAGDSPRERPSADSGEVDHAPREGRIPALDGMRGIAILLVMIFHFSESPNVPAGLPTAFAKVTGSFWCGVDLFFVLSGFLITGILFDAKDNDRPLGKFYARRALRILPLQYLLLIVATIYVSIRPTECLLPPGHRIWLWLYSCNIMQAVKGAWIYNAFDHFWSLAVEEQFYFIWPFVVLSFGRRTLTRICLALIIAAPLIRLAMFASGADSVSVYVLTPCRMDALAIGALLALLARGPGGLARYRGAGKWIGVYAAIALVVVGIFRGGLSHLDPVVSVVGFSFVALIAASVVAHATLPGRVATLFNWPILRSFGRYSYGIYIIQQPMLKVLTQSRYAPLLDRLPYWTSTTLELAIGIVTSFVLAYLSWHCYEQYFLKMKRFFR